MENPNKKSISQLQKDVKDTFEGAFGSTPLTQRLDDILGEAIELSRYTDLKNLREETGDLLASTIQLANECGWDIEDLITENRLKIEKRRLQYKSLGRKKKIAILGGAFNPIHVGHIQIAQFVLNTSRTFDEVWLMPCYNHMYNKEMASADHRLKMCEIAAEEDARIKVFGYEIQNELSGETYNTVKRLLDTDLAKHECDFSLIMGMDNANTFSSWVNYKELERMIRFVVVQRKGYEVDLSVNWYLKNPHIFLSDAEIMGLSSSFIRNHLLDRPRIAKGMENHFTKKMAKEKVNEQFEKIVENWLHPNVYKYIVENELYFD